MLSIYENDGGYWTGGESMVEEGGGAPYGWTRLPPPEISGEIRAPWVGYAKDKPPPYVPPPETDAQVAARVLAERDERLAFATLRIAPLQDAVDLDMATDEEVALLKKWKAYRVLLSRIDQQTGFPRNIAWPIMPT